MVKIWNRQYFVARKTTNSNWRLRLFPQGNKDYSDYLSVFIELVSGDEVKVTFKMWLQNGDNQLVNNGTDTYKFDNTKWAGYNSFIQKRDLMDKTKKFLPNDQLTIVTEIIINDGFMNITGQRSLINQNLSNYYHAENFMMLLENEMFSDVRLALGEYEFPAHKAILAASSPVFLAEFEKDYNKNRSIIEMKDIISPEVFKEVLQFLYTGKVENIEKLAKEILPVANDCQIKQLQVMCEDALYQTLNDDNAVDYFSLADKYNAKDLKSQAFNYITANAPNVVNTPGFKSMEASDPHPILKIFRALMENKYSTG